MGLTEYHSGLDPNPTITYTIVENATNLNAQLSALGVSIVTIDNSGTSPVISTPDMTGVAVGDYDFVVTATSDSDSTITATYDL